MKKKDIENHLLEIFEDTFNKSVNNDLYNFIFNSNLMRVSKWTCFSDYCFNDRNKPNDVMTFTLIPYIDDFNKLSEVVANIAKVDIKNTKYVTEEFICFLKTYPLINFSFIINNNNKKKIRRKIFKLRDKTDLNVLEDTFQFIKQQYSDWIEKQPQQKEYFTKIIKKINCILHLLKNNKKVRQIIDMLLVIFCGAYVSSKVLQQIRNIEIFGWFSDQDAINDICNNFSVELFQYYLHRLINGKDITFVSCPASSSIKIFYDVFVRIPDYLAGTLADYNMNENTISKNKFDKILTNYMAENQYNNFIFRLFAEDDKLSCPRILIHKKTNR